MSSKISLTKKDIIITLGCTLFLLLNLGAIGSGGRRRAKETVCLSNLHQWGAILQMDTESNNDYFYSGYGAPGFWWIRDLEDRYKDWKQNKLWFCPMATMPLFDEKGNLTVQSNVFCAWGILTGTGLGPHGISGSYGLNSYLLNPPSTDYPFEGGRNVKNNWRTPNVKGADKIPAFADCLRFDGWPLDTDLPPAFEDMSWSISSHIARFSINRHDGAVNVLFLDWSARKIGLKELWTLKWHRTYNTSGPWTIAGGVQTTHWPQWIKNFKDY
jgi:prepilin-type processing-associated H-X9-DG protein